MRTGGYTVHQTLTAEAATTVKHAITLARRRGHAQVTPLHVATTMLASSTGLLQTACLQSHSHPHQCKALELCFNGQACSDDVASVLDSLMSKRRNNTIIVGECLASTERIVRGVIDTFDRGDVPMDMRYVQFISLPLLTLKNLPIEEAEKKLEELRSLVRGYLSRGVVLYLGDLKWVSEFWSNYGGHSRNYNCLVGHMVMEISRLLCGIRESGKLWLMGISTFQTYMRCKIGQPSLETLWQLHPLTIPACSLGLSLKLESDLHGESKSKLSGEESSWSQIKFGVEKNLTCCIDCLANFNKEAQNIANNTHYNESTTTSTCSSLPSWLQKYKQENKRENANNQELNKLRELYLLSNPNSSPNSASSSEANENFECLNSFKEFNSDNFKVLCNALGNKVPWQKEIIPDIVYTILQCRSKMVPRKGNSKKREEKEETWLFFLGVDFKGKEKIAKELAKIVFGSKDNFVTIGLSNFSSTRADSSEEMSKKRVRDESSSTYLERFAEAVEENPSRLFFMEDLEQVDYFSQKGIKRAIENGRIGLSSGELVPLKDTIVIFSSESLSSISRACSPPPVRPKSSERKEKDDERTMKRREECVVHWI
ncbi:double Clp-N motif-containing P-loop nucleoside triphosphate hydrolases superfamily protein [Actinidia rufa]|uniref:Double Clp-N motif-containing P-loop nucleoside triphosphate hydrolases superfamily protein n=1 Tax=Actinidia rufa TaxID=165716 RepID=A0A7J0GLK9_9ERIC|nr:double Clp-N motif-containing P-loop nucleoside triphosphate hydrolases superfamily protein [Actinidia rufa]